MQIPAECKINFVIAFVLKYLLHITCINFHCIVLCSRCRQLQFVVWSPGGALFAIPMDKRLEISGTEKAGVLHTLDLPTKITTCTFLSVSRPIAYIHLPEQKN